MSYTQAQIEGFADVAQSLKLYRRAELIDEKSGQLLISDLYVDPLPENAVINGILRPNTTFLIGRKGTGKSTIFQRAQAQLRQNKATSSAYLDIKTLFEESQVDTSALEKIPKEYGALPRHEIEKLLLYRGFVVSVLTGIRDELKRKLKESWKANVAEKFTGTLDELFENFDELLNQASADRFVSVLGARHIAMQNKAGESSKSGQQASVGISAKGLACKVEGTAEQNIFNEGQKDFSDLLLRTFNLKELLLELKKVLGKAGLRHLYIFVDDFSELPEEAMRLVVDTLLAPLNNWSEEFIKFKIAAYPTRIYYGQIDKTKIDEIHLDIFQLYGASDISTMEIKAAEFLKRLVSSRLSHFCDCPPAVFFETDDDETWKTLFFASMGNPRTLGYLLFYVYESTLIYKKRIGPRSIRDAAQKFFEEKLEPYFAINKFLHESFVERSSIFSLKELLEKVVTRARELRQHKDSQIMRDIEGRPPTSHFHVIREYEAVFASLELNFFVSRYFEMSDRDGRKVTVFALNYGLCQKYSIEFGRPTGKREFRLYFVERVFDYSGIVKAHIEANQEIVCDKCGSVFGMDKLEHLKFFKMLCSECREGTCYVSNLSKKYEQTLRSVNENLLLPPTELGILKTLHSEKKPLYAGDIAGELDCSYQLVGRRAKYLAERGLVNRQMNDEDRREFTLTKDAESTYFPADSKSGLELTESPQAVENL